MCVCWCEGGSDVTSHCVCVYNPQALGAARETNDTGGVMKVLLRMANGAMQIGQYMIAVEVGLHCSVMENIHKV